MGLYAKYVLPRVIDIVMRNKDAARLRSEWIPKARGEVLEVGIGSGLNLRFYSSEVKRVYGVDPSVELQRIARTRMTAASFTIDFLTQSAEAALPLANASIDTAVMTWTLCSIANPTMALCEIKRVPSPILTLPSIKQNGPISTPSARSASGPMTALGWMLGGDPRRSVLNAAASWGDRQDVRGR